MNSEIDDLRSICEPNSNQLNADDLINGPQVFTIKRIAKGPRGKKGDQPMHVHLVEFPRGPWKPPVSIRRLMMELWGENPARWPEGGRVELFRDPDVYFGDEQAGGVRVSGVSHIKESVVDVLVTTGRGKRTKYTISRLEAAPAPNLASILADAELTEADVNAWLASKGKPELSDRDTFAKWLSSHMGALTEIRAARVTP